MGTWNLYHASTTTITPCVDPDKGSWMKSCITPGLQRIPSCSGWGSYPRWKGSHPLPAYERCLKTFICCGWAHGSITMKLPPHVLTQIWEVSWNLHHCWSWATQDSIVRWLRLLINMEWFPHPLPTITGLGHVHLLWMTIWIHHLPLPPNVKTLMLQISWNLLSMLGLGYKGWDDIV